MEQRGYFLAKGDRRAVVAIDVHGEIYAVSRWAGVKSKDVVSRMGEIEALPSVAEAREHVARKVQTVLHGFIRSASDDFAEAAKAMEAKRLAMVHRHRASRSELQSAHDERWTREAVERAERFRKGFLGLWDRVTGKHAKLRQRNAEETAAAARRDAAEKQAIIERQLEGRQSLQREILNARRIHTRDLTRIYREIFASERFKRTVEPDSEAIRARHRITARLGM